MKVPLIHFCDVLCVAKQHGCDKTHQTTGKLRSERKMSQALESYQHKEEHTSHCSFFDFVVSRENEWCEVIAEISGDHI